jgi:hypothetical protein
LTRIESSAFSYSSLQSIVIPRNVKFIDGSAFIGVTLSSISIESGNEIFVIENDFLIDILRHKLIRNFSKSSAIELAGDIEILGSNCFSRCKSLSSIRFEPNSRLTRIESNAFSNSSFESILIPDSVEILQPFCLHERGSLSSIKIEFKSRLIQIESEACSSSSLQSIVIPRNVKFIDGSAVIGVALSLVSIESRNRIFVLENGLLFVVLHHKLIRNFSEFSEIEIARNVEMIGLNCFSYCLSFSLITFESNSRLTRIESEAFYESSLQSIVIPSKRCPVM